jgi:ceramide glucosyltransferase
MAHAIFTFIEVLGVLGTFCSLGYYGVCITSAIRFLRERKAREGARPTQSLPPVSILKPLKGVDPGMYGNLRSHCLQDYPDFEIIFGVSDAADPAVEFVERVKTDFPHIAIRLVVCERALGTNLKVSSLAQMLPAAKYEDILVNDSDIRVEPDYLSQVMAPLSDIKIGLVTCLYRGVPSSSLGSTLESLFIGTDFCAGVLAARLIEGGIHFGLGSTLAFRRPDLEAIGGFEALADYLADDYEIGRRMAARGLGIALSETVVETFLPPYSFRQFLDHQLRWARTIRDSRRGGYAGLAATFGLVWAALALLFARGAAWAWMLFAAAGILRYCLAVIVGRGVLRDRQLTRWLPLMLIPLRDFVAFFVWLAGFRSGSITWRGNSFELKDGKLIRIVS